MDAREVRPGSPLVVIQARMASRRLPGKVLAELCGQPILAWLLQRVQLSRLAGGVVVATTTDPSDDELVDVAKGLGASVFRGHPTDVLGRFRAVLEATGADVLVRISADSPFLDDQTVDTIVADFANGDADLVENHRRPGWPVGTAVEVVTAPCLRRLAHSARSPRHREHVTLYAYEHPNEFTIRHVPFAGNPRASTLRLCVDTAEDLERVRRMCAEFAPRRDFSVIDLVDRFSERQDGV